MYDEAMHRFERGLLARALADAGGNKSHAAKALGIPRTTLIGRCESLQPTDADAERVFRDEKAAALAESFQEFADMAATLPHLFKRYELKVYIAKPKDRPSVEIYEFNRLRKTCETIATSAAGLRDRLADALGVQPERGPRHDGPTTEKPTGHGITSRP